MDDGLVLLQKAFLSILCSVLILVVVDDGLVHSSLHLGQKQEQLVLILVVVDDGLVQSIDLTKAKLLTRLNPCCSGRWSSTVSYWMEKFD